MCLTPDFRLLTDEGNAGDEAAFDKLTSLMEETYENGVLEPYYNTSYGAYFLDRWVRRLCKGLMENMYTFAV